MDNSGQTLVFSGNFADKYVMDIIITIFENNNGKLLVMLALKKKMHYGENLEKLMSTVELEKQNDFKIEHYTEQIDHKHQKYLEDIDQLQTTKFKIIELSGNLDSLQLELSFQEEQLESTNRNYKK